MRTGMMAWCVGITTVAWLPLLLPLWLVIAALALTILALCLFRNAVARAWLRAASGYLLGLLWGTGYGLIVTGSLLPTALEQKPLWLSGRIDGLIETRTAFGKPTQRFSLRVDGCYLDIPALNAPHFDAHSLDNLIVDNKSACGVVLHTVELTAYAPLPIASGERWRLQVKLKRPHGFANPGGFDFESWLVQQRYSAVGSVVSGANTQRLEFASSWSVDHWRAVLRDYLQARLAMIPHRNLLLALLVADGSSITRDEWLLFRATGTIHLFVVSGSHIAFTGGLIWWLSRLWRRLPWSTGSRREHVLSALPALFIAGVYALLAGMGLPIQRALIMFAVLLLTTTWRRDSRISDAMLLALVLVLLCDPLAARDAGCWFSFAAVAALVIAIAQVYRRAEVGKNGAIKKDRWSWLRAQWLVFVVCVPVLMLIGGQLTLLSLPANLVAVPFTTVLTLPLAFAALLLESVSAVLAAKCWWAADLSLQWLLQYLSWLRAHGAGLILPLPMSLAAGFFAMIAVLLSKLPRAVPGRAFALLLLLPVLWPRYPEIAQGALRLTVIDVGQGLSVLVETHSHQLLYDTGPAFGSGSSAAELAVLPLLQQRGVRALDMLMVSHHDSDHAGGVHPILETVAVADTVVGEDLHLSQQRFCAAGQHWQWDDAQFTVISPESSDDQMAAKPAAGNNRSCVLRISAGTTSVLLTGDIEAPVEAHLLDHRLPEQTLLENTTVLVAPHHGSRSSSSPAFVQAVSPQIVLFSAGYRSPFGHPHPQVVARYQAIGAQLFNTAATGAITLELHRDGVAAITEYRKTHRHYWDAAGI